ncbi:histidine kinase [Apiospora arundinis]
MGSRVRESVREREVLSYDPALLANIAFNDQAIPIPNAQLRSSIDPVLTSLAQLGACRTGSARSFVSLFDKKWQYIVAEATPTISLAPDLADVDRNGEELWLCRTAIPRAHGVCEWTLLYDEPGEELPVSMVADLQADSRFCAKPYCVAGSPARFYASAPIRSSRGINIGVYCVLHDEPISEEEAKAKGLDVIVRQITRTIMSHLEAQRSTVALKRSENMIRGVGAYVSNQSEAHLDFQTEHSPTRRNLGSAPTSPKDTVLSRAASEPGHNIADGDTLKQPNLTNGVAQDICDDKKCHAAGDTIEENAAISSPTDNPVFRPDVAPRTISSASAPLSKSLPSDEDDLPLGGIFMRAATVVRRSLEIGDVTFFNASSGSFGSMVDAPSHPDHSPDQMTTSSSSDEMSVRSRSHDNGVCHVLGTSRPTMSTTNIPPSAGPPVVLPASLLSSLLKRHPRGRIFTFDEHGALQTSESSEDSATQPLQPGITTQRPQCSRSKTRWSRQRQGEVLLELFPGARSICFVPIWDDKKERWFAGGIACTYERHRIFTPAVELSFFRAFGTLLMADVHRLEATRSHQAQSDVLGSISHELRSPLHGLILSAELLADTHISPFQGNILHTIETCGRTLLDTVDHLLDYSKVNHFMNSNRKRKARGTHGKGLSIEDGMKAQASEVRLDTLVEEVAESVFAGFCRMSTEYSFQHDRRKTTDPDIGATASASVQDAEQMKGPWNSSLNQDDGVTPSAPARVTVYLDIEPGETYKCRTVAGAIRRVVMNLLGNSLKYTDKGWIEVRLSRDAVATRRHGIKQNMIRITVTDTGKGMSKDFLDNYIFKPFAQEDQLSAGTGVGLSLVKKLVSSLGGEISVKSQVNIGSTVNVLLPLTTVVHETMESREEEAFREQQQMLKGLRVRLVGFRPTTDDSKINAGGSVSAIEKVCKGWLGMEVVSEFSDLAPDVILCFEAGLGVALHTQGEVVKPPIVVVCANATTAHARTMASAGGSMRVRTGPRKLARILLLAFNRWLELQDVSVPTGSIHSAPTLTPSTEAGPLSTPATSVDAEYIRSPSCSGPAASKSDSYFPQIEGPSKPAYLPGAEPSYPDEIPNRSKATSCPLPLTLPPIVPSPAESLETVKPLPAEFLLVDDNPINLRILCAYMKKLDRPFSTAVDGLEAVETFKANPGRFACILMDISMPRLDGLKATQQIRSHERETVAEACAIFALTGLASAETQRDAFESGIGLFLTKPVKLKELSEILQARGLI